MFPVLAAAAGAAAMYFFDPDQGRRRRALMRDKFAWFKDEMGDVREAAAGRAEDLRNRTKGMLHEVKKGVGKHDGQARESESDRMEETDRIRSSAMSSQDYGTDTIQKAA